MTWDELVFRPIDSDPFIYQGQAEKDWERRQRVEGSLPDLRPKEPSDTGDEIAIGPYISPPNAPSDDPFAFDPNIHGRPLDGSDIMPLPPHYRIEKEEDPCDEVLRCLGERPDVFMLGNRYMREGPIVPLPGQDFLGGSGLWELDPDDPFAGIPLGGPSAPAKKCRPSWNIEFGVRRNLVIYPPPMCTRSLAREYAGTRDPLVRAKLVNFYKKLKDTCFNKLIITEMSIEEVKAAISAGWKLNDMVLEVQCCEWCAKGERGCPNLETIGLRRLLIEAQEFYRTVNGADDPRPGFYQYFFDEQYKNKDGFGKCPHGYCEYNNVARFMVNARIIDNELNNGQHTPIVMGRYCVGAPPVVDCCTRDLIWGFIPGPCQSEFDDFGRLAPGIQADGFAYTGYSSLRLHGHNKMLTLAPLTTTAMVHNTIWFNLNDDQHFLQTGKDIFGRPILKVGERYSNYIPGFDTVNTFGLYAGDWEGTMEIYNTSGQHIGKADACRAGSVYRKRWPEIDDCRCNIFFNFLKDFVKVARANGLVEDYYV